jgi:hypothetical protein
MREAKSKPDAREVRQIKLRLYEDGHVSLETANEEDRGKTAVLLYLGGLALIDPGRCCAMAHASPDDFLKALAKTQPALLRLATVGTVQA